MYIHYKKNLLLKVVIVNSEVPKKIAMQIIKFMKHTPFPTFWPKLIS